MLMGNIQRLECQKLLDVESKLMIRCIYPVESLYMDSCAN